jgi:hypothetical protein
MDGSQTGSGKTYVTGFIAKKLNMDAVFIICPRNVIDNWKKVMALIGIPVLYITTYETWRGTALAPPSHGYIKLHTGKDGKITYTITNELTTLIGKKKVLFIFDEFQKCKNNSVLQEAIVTLNVYLRQNKKTPSAFISATEYDKPEHAFNIFRAMGLTSHTSLMRYDRSRKVYIYTGLMSMRNYARKYTSSPLPAPPTEKDNELLNAHAHTLLTKHIMPHILSSMPFQSYESDINNMIIMPSNDVSVVANKIIEGMLVEIDKIKGKGIVGMSNIINNMHLLEMIKVRLVLPQLIRILLQDSHAKIAVFCNYRAPLLYLQYMLEEAGYAPLMLTGTCTEKQRIQAMEKFNYPNEDHRVFLSITKAGGVGISLHDTHGGYPRHVYIMSDYSIIPVMQAFGRTNRIGMKSKTYQNVVYIATSDKIRRAKQKKQVLLEDLIIEFRMWETLDAKSNVLRDTFSKDLKKNILPGSLPVVLQEEYDIDFNVREYLSYVIENFVQTANQPQLINIIKEL